LLLPAKRAFALLFLTISKCQRSRSVIDRSSTISPFQSLTGTVQLLDILFRKAHKISQKLD